jgi:hypothetical protein
MYLAFVVTIILALKTSVAALPMTPEYVCIFSWMSTYGGFALTVIYLALALGAIKGLKDHAAQGKLWAAIIVAAVVSGAAIFGGLYKVAEPTLSAPLSVIGVLILGLIAGFAMPVPSGADDFSTLVEADQGPQKI